MTSTTWVQNAGMDSGTDSDTVLTYAEAAQAAAEAAAASVLGAAEQASASSGFASDALAAANAAAASASSAETFANSASQGGYQEQQFYLDSPLTNGTFDADTSGWFAGFSLVNGTFIASGGIATLTKGASDGASPRFVTALTGLTIGAVYRITFDEAGATGAGDRLVSWGSNSSGVGGVALNQVTVANWTNETKEFSQIATATTMYLAFAMVNPGVGDTGSIDNISVFEVDANDDVIHTMPKGWKPKDVFEDGLLQREGSAHDYEVVYDGFDYIIKPTVAPSATTQTCVIGVKA